jgi:hypothetical protein
MSVAIMCFTCPDNPACSQIYSNFVIDGEDANGNKEWSLIWVPTSISVIFAVLGVVYIVLTRIN